MNFIISCSLLKIREEFQSLNYPYNLCFDSNRTHNIPEYLTLRKPKDIQQNNILQSLREAKYYMNFITSFN